MESFTNQDMVQLLVTMLVLGVLFVLAMKIGEVIWRLFFVALGIAALYFGAQYFGVDLSSFTAALRDSGIVDKLKSLIDPIMNFFSRILDLTRALNTG